MTDDLMSKDKVQELYLRQLRRLDWAQWVCVVGPAVLAGLVWEHRQALGDVWAVVLVTLPAVACAAVSKAVMRTAASAGEIYGGWEAFRQVNESQSEIARGVRDALKYGENV